MNTEFGIPETKAEFKANYPARAPFVRYLEKLVAPKSNLDKPLLEKRAAPLYLVENWPTSNSFSVIKHERIKELKRQANDRRQAELHRCLKQGEIANKIPKEFRQRFTAHAHLKDLIFEENLNEIRTHGRLFGPPSLTLQTPGKHNVPLTKQTLSDKSDPPFGNDLPNIDVSSAVSKPTYSSISADSSRKDSMFNDLSTKEDSLFAMRLSTKQTQGPTQTFDQINSFINDRKKICMVELAVRTKEGEIDRLNKILEAESIFLAHEEKELLLRHDEHDRYLKSICQRTAEAIHLAENEAHKRNAITDRIKRTRYKLAHLNAECIKLEEEFIRLNTYKEFLDTVAKTLHENREADLKIHAKGSSSLSEIANKNQSNQPDEGSLSSYEEINDSHSENSDPKTPLETEDVNTKIDHINIPQNDTINTELKSPIVNLLQVVPSDGSISIKIGKHPNILINANKQSIISHVSSESKSLSINSYFKSPQDLVDILSELESNNLTLIENVQEQEEACERVRVKAARLQRVLNFERSTVDEHIAREKLVIDDLKQNVNDVAQAKEAINEFTLLERYEHIFNLGKINQFEEPWLRKEKSRRSTDEDVQKPTVSELLDILHKEIHKIYSKIFGFDNAASLDTLMMLKILEITIDDLSRTLSGYSRNQVLKAKRTVDEHNRFMARQHQKELESLAHDARLRKAIAKAIEPPRWHRGRKIIHRSCPPEQRRLTVVQQEQQDTEDADLDLFQM